MLNTAKFQSFVNRVPEKFQISWASGWTIIPGIIHAKDVQVGIQTPRVQWWLSTRTGKARFAFLPLFERTLESHWLSATDVQYRLRPRPDANKDFSQIKSYFPEIPGFEWKPPDVDETRKRAVSARKKPWRFRLNNLDVKNLHQASLYNYRLEGDVSANINLDFLSRNELSVPVGEMTAKVKRVFYNDTIVGENIDVSGTFNIDSYVPRQNRGIKALQFINGQLEVGGYLSSLGVLDYYLRGADWLKLNGKGAFRSTLLMKKGKLLEGSKAQLSQAAINLHLKQYVFSGKGSINGLVDNVSGTISNQFKIIFDNVEVIDPELAAPLVKATGLTVGINGPEIEIGQKLPLIAVDVSLPDGKIPDLSVYNRFLPKKTRIVLDKGSGNIGGKLVLAGESVSGKVSLSAAGMNMTVFDNAIQSDVNTEVVLVSSAIRAGVIDISGTKFMVENARLQESVKGRRPKQKPWRGSIVLTHGQIKPSSTRVDGKSRMRFQNGSLRVDSEVSDIGFLNTLLSPKSKQLILNGAGKVNVELRLDESGFLPGSSLTANSSRLSAQLLLFKGVGRGTLDGKLIGSRNNPLFDAKITLNEVSIKNTESEAPHLIVPELVLDVDGHLHNIKAGLKNVGINVSVPNAVVPDIRVYNSYLPENGDIAFIAGKGNLNLNFQLNEEKADGEITLKADVDEATIKRRPVSGKIIVRAKLADGDLNTMHFDASNSSVELQNLLALDKPVERPQPWSAKLNIAKGGVRWRRPLEFEGQATLLMKNTRPILDLLSPPKGSGRLVKKMFTVENIVGQSDIRMNRKELVFNNLDISGGKLNIKSKLRFANKILDGIVYARYDDFSAAIEFENGKRDWKFIRAQKKYNAFPIY